MITALFSRVKKDEKRKKYLAVLKEETILIIKGVLRFTECLKSKNKRFATKVFKACSPSSKITDCKMVNALLLYVFPNQTALCWYFFFVPIKGIVFWCCQSKEVLSLEEREEHNFFTEKPVCIMSMSYQTVLFHERETYLTVFRSEKLLVVLLVASATVCFLTNLLVLLILSLSTQRKYNRGRRVKLMLRYQLMRNQAIIGLFTASVVVYPLKVSHKNVRCKIASYYRVSKNNFGDGKLWNNAFLTECW